MNEFTEDFKQSSVSTTSSEKGSVSDMKKGFSLLVSGLSDIAKSTPKLLKETAKDFKKGTQKKVYDAKVWFIQKDYKSMKGNKKLAFNLVLVFTFACVTWFSLKKLYSEAVVPALGVNLKDTDICELNLLQHEQPKPCGVISGNVVCMYSDERRKYINWYLMKPIVILPCRSDKVLYPYKSSACPSKPEKELQLCESVRVSYVNPVTMLSEVPEISGEPALCLQALLSDFCKS